eukprot:gene29797-38943_t
MNILNYESRNEISPRLFSVKPTSAFLRCIEDATNATNCPKIVFFSESEAKILIGDNEFSIRLAAMDHMEVFVSKQPKSLDTLTFCGDVQRSLRISNTKLAAIAPAIIKKDSSSIRLEVEIKSPSLQQASNTSNHHQTTTKNNSPASKVPRKPSKCAVERTDTDKNLKKMAVKVEQRTSVPWVVCRRVPVSYCARDFQRFFTGLNTLHVCFSTGEVGPLSVVEAVDVFLEFDRCAGAELAMLRSGEKLLSEKNNHVSMPLQVEFITEEDSVWAKHLGLVMNGNVSIRDRLQVLHSILPAEYLLLDVFKVSSQWSPITNSMTHFHRRSQAVGGKRTAQSVNGMETNSSESNKNLRNRFQHLQGNILLDEIFLDEFIFSMEIAPSATLSRWIRIYKVILGELWSIRYTYSAGFTSELVLPSDDKKKKKQKQLLHLE